MLYACSREETPPPPAAPEPAPTPQLTLDTPLPQADQAGSVPLRELIWPAPDTPAAQFCDWRAGNTGPLFDSDAFTPSVIEVGAAGAVHFAGNPLSAEQLAAALRDGRERWEAADNTCITRQGGVGIARVPQAALAVAPDVSTQALVPVLSAVASAGIERLYVLVDGPAGPDLPDRFDDDDVQIHATRAQLRHKAQTAPMPPDSQPIALDGLGVSADKVRCALLGVGTDAPWQDTVQMMDRLAAVGARRVLLIQDDTLPASSAAPDAVARPAPVLDLSGVAAAHLMDIPQLRPADPDGGHSSACAPILRIQPMPLDGGL